MSLMGRVVGSPSVSALLRAPIAAAVAANVLACSSASSSSLPSEDAIGTGAGPLYVVQSTVFTVDGSTSYIGTVGTLDGSEAFDTSNALELAGTARTFGPEMGGWIAVGDNEAFTVTRYELEGDN